MEVIDIPESDSASKWLGVTNVASGRICRLERLVGVQRVPGLLALADQHGIQHHVVPRLGGSAAATVSNGGRAAHHAELDRVQRVRAPEQVWIASSWSAMTCASTGTKRWFQLSRGSKETMQVSAVMP